MQHASPFYLLPRLMYVFWLVSASFCLTKSTDRAHGSQRLLRSRKLYSRAKKECAGEDRAESGLLDGSHVDW